jgi:hypothetical protein
MSRGGWGVVSGEWIKEQHPLPRGRGVVVLYVLVFPDEVALPSENKQPV